MVSLLFLPLFSLFIYPFPEIDLSIGRMFVEKHSRLAFIFIEKHSRLTFIWVRKEMTHQLCLFIGMSIRSKLELHSHSFEFCLKQVGAISEETLAK